jgi:WD40 repeat protein
MAQQLICPQGHQWDIDTAVEARSPGASAVCPVCRAPAVTPAADPADAPNPLTEAFSPRHPRLPDSAAPGPATMPPTAPAPSNEAAELPTIPGYEILGVLGRGGMGVVYKAWQPELNRTVALKMVLAGAHAGAQELARFHTEAEAVARLHHAHIVQIYGVGRHDEHPYLVLEYVDGGSLAQQLTGTLLPARRSAELVETLARAVHYAHQQGIIHRDLTPGNVLLTADGLPKITDFGLAKLLAGGGAIRTQSGAIVGTPSYMAPEQAAGKTKEIGPAADVYGLGAILYELVTGRPPFRAETPLETLLQAQSEEPVPPSRLQPKLPRDLETICLKALAKSPERRYASAGDLAEDLRRWLSGEPIRARPVSAAERLLKWVRRRPAVAGLLLASGVAALALVALAVGWVYNRELSQARAAEEWQRQRAEAALGEARDALDKADTYLYFNRISLAEHAWWANNVGRTKELLAECPPERCLWEWHYLDRLCHSELLALSGHTDEIYSVTVSPDSTRLASASADKTVKIWEVATGRELLTLPCRTRQCSVIFSRDGTRLASAGADGPEGDLKVWSLDFSAGPGSIPRTELLLDLPGLSGERCQVAFSPDGQRLALACGFPVSRKSPVRVFEVASGKEILTLQYREEEMTGVAFSPDGRQLVFVSGTSNFSGFGKPGVVRIWDTASGQEPRPLEGQNGPLATVAFSPDGKTLAWAGWDKVVKLWDIAAGKEVGVLRGHTAMIRQLAFRPDGRQLATASEDGSVKVWNVAAAEELFTLRGHTADVYCVAYHRDGERLVSGGIDQMIRIWDARSGQEARTLNQSAPVRSVACSSDGRLLAAGGTDKTVQVWDLRAGGHPRLLGRHEEGVWCVAFAPDGSRLASCSGDWHKKEQAGEIKVWDVASGQELLRLPAHHGVVWNVAFSPDGKRLASAGGELSAPDEVKIWDAVTGKELFSFPQPKGVHCIAFSPDGRCLAGVFVHSNTLKVWDVEQRQELFSVQTAPHPWSVSFTPDGRRLLTGALLNLEVWDAATGQRLKVLQGHTSDVMGVACSPDGKRLATAGYDKTLKVWDAATGQEVLTLKGHTGTVTSVVFSPDGKRLVSGSEDQTMKIWDATPRDTNQSDEQPAP